MGKLKQWTGTKWAPVKRWSGTRWDQVYSYDGAWGSSGPPTTPTVIGHTEGIDLPAGATTFQPTLPSGLVAGDRIILAMMCTDNSTGVTITPTVPAGWTVQTPLANQGTCQRVLLAATYTAGLVAPSWVLSAARRNAYACVAVRPAAGQVIGSTDIPASGTDLVAPSVTATAVGIVIRLFLRKDNISTNITLPAGHTQIGKVIGTTGPAPHVLTCSAPIAAAGATGTATAVCTAASANGTSWTVAVS
jgi:hypothetical protein